MKLLKRLRLAWTLAKVIDGPYRPQLASYEERVEFFRAQYGDGEALEKRVLAAQCTCLTTTPYEVIEWDPECPVHLSYVDDLTDQEREEIDQIGRGSNT